MVGIFVVKYFMRHMRIARPLVLVVARVAIRVAIRAWLLRRSDAQSTYPRVDMPTTDLPKRDDRLFVQHLIDFIVEPVHPVGE